MYISSVGSNSNATYQIYSKLSSGKKINSAADDPAGLAVAKKMQTQSTGYQTENKNIADSQNLLNTTDGAMSSVTDALQRMRELAVQGTNGLYSAEDKKAIQSEINQLKDQIQSISKGTQFNGVQTLNGSSMDLSGSTETQSYNTSLESLGIEDFDITKIYDLRDLDRAMNRVSSMQGEAGASVNGMSHTMNSNSVADLNIQSAQSGIEDIDMGHAVMELKMKQLQNQSSTYVQHQLMQNAASTGGILNLLA